MHSLFVLLSWSFYPPPLTCWRYLYLWDNGHVLEVGLLRVNEFVDATLAFLLHRWRFCQHGWIAWPWKARKTHSQGEIFKKWDEPFQKISLRGFYIFGILRTSRLHFCVITLNKCGGIFLICIFPKWPPRLSNTQKFRHIATCTNTL